MMHLIQDLVKIRNKILNTSNKLIRIYEESESFKNYTKEDVLNLLEMIDSFRANGYLLPHYLWDIPLKNHSKEYYEDGEMSE
mmetsp:Transcript_20062/g.17759  ORF Transcript_20062/g.17759 Transcript_20062/m.17759 type:complete len:82 (+) Transcript_20062:679-924(+)